ncbi:unnamed protein product [Boreogadus saida]
MDSAMTSIAMLTDTMVTDSPTPSLRSGLTTTTDGDSLMSTASVPCCHFLSANVINIGECFVAEVTSCPPGLLGVIRSQPHAQRQSHKGESRLRSLRLDGGVTTSLKRDSSYGNRLPGPNLPAAVS